jgi:transcriptional regulator with XRE-family HTH domain
MNTRLGTPERAPRLVRQLWALMAARGWTVERLARQAGVSVGCLERWRGGRRRPQLEPLARCFAALGCDLQPMPRCEARHGPKPPQRVLEGLQRADRRT